jgi:hypothetical protein
MLLRPYMTPCGLFAYWNELVIVVDAKEIVPAWFIRNADQAIPVSVPAGPSGLL